MPNYELTYILRPVEEANLTAANTRITNTLSAQGGELVARHDWGRRRLAYPIRKAIDGYYTTLYITLPPTSVRTLERSLQLMEDILRYVVVRVDKLTPPTPPPTPPTAPAAAAEPTAVPAATTVPAPTPAPAPTATSASTPPPATEPSPAPSAAMSPATNETPAPEAAASAAVTEGS